MSTSSAIEAFNIGAGAAASSVSSLIIPLTFALLLTVFAYIALMLFDELKIGNLTIKQYSLVVVRVFVLFCILGYFLLR
ncbi:DUF3262 family protein [Pasteurella skyensis]|uniref:DUF3262 family protein n=1 Tax=Phocoenobacter skyensis TaxID=97481 RepID=UPI0027611716|nr:DUF3262 family protein [Pasteurella skyensis]MDP8189073.1 DUF3262 family protein [Pasteurella skyensis]